MPPGDARAVVAASRQLEDYDVELGRESYRAGIATLDPLEPDARGPEAMHQRIYRAAHKIVRDGKFLIGLGGEHGITSALVRAVCAKHKTLSVLQIWVSQPSASESAATPARKRVSSARLRR